MILLWQELNNLARQGLRLLAGLLLVLAVLNVGVGGVALVDTDPLDSSGKAAGNGLLHLQLFGLIHIHENILEEHMHALSPPPGVVEYDTTYQPPSQALFISVSALAGTGPSLSLQSADYGPGWVQNLISDFLPAASPELGLPGYISNFSHFNDRPQIEPFLAVPEKPPTFPTYL